MTIERREVVSSNIAAFAYDSLMSNLLVEFKNGSVYEYVNVPREVFETATSAESAGRYFQSSIKPHYDFLRLK